MSTTTILHAYEELLAVRVEQGEIADSTRESYLNDASRIVESILRHTPLPVIEGYLSAEGYRGDYGHVIETLRTMAREHSHRAFGQQDS